MPLNWYEILFFKKRMVFFILILFSFAACDLEMLKPTLKIPYNTTFSFQIDSADYKSDVVILYEKEASLDIDSLIVHYGGNPELMTNAEIQSITLRVLEPEGTDISFLASSHVSILSDTFEDAVVARSSDIGLSGTEITYDLTPEAGNVLAYTFESEVYTIRIYGMMASPLPVESIQLQVEIKWEFSVTPF